MESLARSLGLGFLSDLPRLSIALDFIRIHLGNVSLLAPLLDALSLACEGRVELHSVVCRSVQVRFKCAYFIPYAIHVSLTHIQVKASITSPTAPSKHTTNRTTYDSDNSHGTAMGIIREWVRVCIGCIEVSAEDVCMHISHSQDKDASHTLRVTARSINAVNRYILQEVEVEGQGVSAELEVQHLEGLRGIIATAEASEVSAAIIYTEGHMEKLRVRINGTSRLNMMDPALLIRACTSMQDSHEHVFVECSELIPSGLSDLVLPRNRQLYPHSRIDAEDDQLAYLTSKYRRATELFRIQLRVDESPIFVDSLSDATCASESEPLIAIDVLVEQCDVHGIGASLHLVRTHIERGLAQTLQIHMDKASLRTDTGSRDVHVSLDNARLVCAIDDAVLSLELTSDRAKGMCCIDAMTALMAELRTLSSACRPMHSPALVFTLSASLRDVALGLSSSDIADLPPCLYDFSEPSSGTMADQGWRLSLADTQVRFSNTSVDVSSCSVHIALLGAWHESMRVLNLVEISSNQRCQQVRLSGQFNKDSPLEIKVEAQQIIADVPLDGAYSLVKNLSSLRNKILRLFPARRLGVVIAKAQCGSVTIRLARTSNLGHCIQLRQVNAECIHPLHVLRMQEMALFAMHSKSTAIAIRPCPQTRSHAAVITLRLSYSKTPHLAIEMRDFNVKVECVDSVITQSSLLAADWAKPSAELETSALVGNELTLSVMMTGGQAVLSLLKVTFKLDIPAASLRLFKGADGDVDTVTSVASATLRVTELNRSCVPIKLENLQVEQCRSLCRVCLKACILDVVTEDIVFLVSALTKLTQCFASNVAPSQNTRLAPITAPPARIDFTDFSFVEFEVYDGTIQENSPILADAYNPDISVDEYGEYIDHAAGVSGLYSFGALDHTFECGDKYESEIYNDYFSRLVDSLSSTQAANVSRTELTVELLELSVRGAQDSHRSERRGNNRAHSEILKLQIRKVSLMRDFAVMSGTQCMRVLAKDMRVAYSSSKHVRRTALSRWNQHIGDEALIQIDVEGGDGALFGCEWTVFVHILPLRCYLETGMTVFLDEIASRLSDIPSALGQSSYVENACTVSMHVQSTRVKVDYVCDCVDLVRLRRGDTTQMLSMFPLEGLELQLNCVSVHGGAGGLIASARAVYTSWRKDAKRVRSIQAMQRMPQFKGLCNVFSKLEDLLNSLCTPASIVGKAVQVEETSVALAKVCVLESVELIQRTCAFTTRAIRFGSNTITSHQISMRITPQLRPRDYVQQAYRCLRVELEEACWSVHALLLEEMMEDSTLSTAKHLLNAIARPVVGVSEAVSVLLLGVRHQLLEVELFEDEYCREARLDDDMMSPRNDHCSSDGSDSEAEALDALLRV